MSTLRAFTLIEVLIAVLVLALGLLGIGALFPVVLNQQRVSTDETLGVIAAGNAAAKFRGTPVNLQGSSFWEQWREQLFRNSNRDYIERRWVVGSDGRNPAFVLDDDGNTLLDVQGGNEFSIPLGARVESFNSSNARFVWDLAIQPLADGGDFKDDKLRIAFFIRRFDRRYDPARSAVPVGEIGDRPTLDGTGVYSRVRKVTARMDTFDDPDPDIDIDIRRDRLFFTGLSDEEWQLVAKLEQKLVDNYGNVFAVKGWNETQNFVKIDPPIPGSLTYDMLDTGVIDRNYELIFTPQVPVAVLIDEVTP